MKIYEEKDGVKKFVAIQCDFVGCPARIEFDKNLAVSGWTTKGVIEKNDGKDNTVMLDWHYCPDHSGTA